MQSSRMDFACHAKHSLIARPVCAVRPELHRARGYQKCGTTALIRKRIGPLYTFKLRPRSVARAAAAAQPFLQLATAKLPADVNADAFSNALYDWASTLTSSGRNLPFSLPLKIRKIDRGFEIALLRISNGEPVSVGRIVASVENESQVGNVLFVRFYEGEGAQAVRSSPLPSVPHQRLKIVIDGLVDVPLIMGTMKNAIKQAVIQAR